MVKQIIIDENANKSLKTILSGEQPTKTGLLIGTVTTNLKFKSSKVKVHKKLFSFLDERRWHGLYSKRDTHVFERATRREWTNRFGLVFESCCSSAWYARGRYGYFRHLLCWFDVFYWQTSSLSIKIRIVFLLSLILIKILVAEQIVQKIKWIWVLQADEIQFRACFVFSGYQN